MPSDRLRDALAPFPEIKLVILFGSVAERKARRTSDVDVAIACSEPIEPERKKAYLESIAAAMERPIDLVDLLRAPPPLIATIFSTGKLLRKDDRLLYARLIRRLWRWNADLAGNHRRLLAQRRKKAFAP